MRFFSPAKANLFFRVLKKRDDGYHDIASLFQAVDLGDILEFEEGEGFSFDGFPVPTGQDNLIFRAVELFKKKSGLNFSVKINLRKRIPLMSGLGGGSSNAATTLWALNDIFAKGSITDERLASWGAEIGSDVPFFFSSGTAYCQGRGEILRTFSLQPLSFWIAKPRFGLSTREVFMNHRVETGRDPELSLREFSLKPCLYNDLESSAFSLSPKLEKIKIKLLDSGFSQVSMSGSGTSFICLGDICVPEIEEVDFYRVNSITRKDNSWYSA